MWNRKRTVNSHSIFPSENENDDHNNQTETNTETLQYQTFVEPISIPTGIAQQNPFQAPESSYSETIIERVQNPSVDLQEQFCEGFFVGQTQAERNG